MGANVPARLLLKIVPLACLLILLSETTPIQIHAITVHMSIDFANKCVLNCVGGLVIQRHCDWNDNRFVGRTDPGFPSPQLVELNWIAIGTGMKHLNWHDMKKTLNWTGHGELDWT